MKKRTLTETIQRVEGSIPSNYEMRYSDITQLGEIARNDLYAAISAAFEYGYIMGHKATVAGKYTER